MELKPESVELKPESVELNEPFTFSNTISNLTRVNGNLGILTSVAEQSEAVTVTVTVTNPSVLLGQR